MAGEMQVLAALNRMLESKETREQTRMQNALAMMQFAQQKKMADYQLASSQLQTLNLANQTIQAREAETFASATGLGAFNFEDEEGKGVEDARKYLTKKIKVKKGVNQGGLGLSEIQANEMISSYVAHRAGNHAAILGLASELADIADKKQSNVVVSGEENKLFTAFQQGIGYFDDTKNAQERLGSIRKSIDNSNAIIEEQFDLAKGDTKISEEIKAFSLDDLADAAEEMDVISESFVPKTREQASAKAEENINTLNTDISEKNNALQLLEEEQKTLNIYKDSGQLSQSQQEYLDRIPDLKKDIEKDILKLSTDMDEQSTLKRMIDRSKAGREINFPDITSF